MESSLCLFLVLLTHIARAQNQQGFISLDCGLPANELSPYKDFSTGLQFYSDATYIESGKIGRVQANMKTNLQKPYQTLRYFLKGIRNCYNLNVTKGRNHLIRVGFVYGNYDGRENVPNFDMYLGPNLWATIDLHGQENGTTKEIIHIPTSNSLQICLVKTRMTVPVISTLEIRLIRDGTYITQSGSPQLYFRKHLSESEDYLRYPDDDYDRLWTPYFQKDWTQISTTSDVCNSNLYDLPRKALATAAIPTNAYEPLTIEWTNSNHPTAQYYLYAHFAEIQDLGANDTREFNILWNGEVMSSQPIIPKKFCIYTFSSKSPKTCQRGKCSLQVFRTKRSTLPPLLNAIEIYTAIQFPQAETDKSDVDAMKNIATAYRLNKIDWQGDPCFPLRLRWDTVNCSNTDLSTPPRIISLNLSSRRLTGNIAEAIQNLTQLQKLDLSNNNFTGGIPEFLGNMKSLSIINLSGNNLNGPIPQALQKKGLQLVVEGNPKLCPSKSCKKPPKKKKVLLPVVASVASVATVIGVLASVLKMKKPTILGVCSEPTFGADQTTGPDNNLGRSRWLRSPFSVAKIRRVLPSFLSPRVENSLQSPTHSFARFGSQEAGSSRSIRRLDAQTSSPKINYHQEASHPTRPSESLKRDIGATPYDEVEVQGSGSPPIAQQPGEGEPSSKRSRTESDRRREKMPARKFVPSVKNAPIPEESDSLDILRDLIVPQGFQIPPISSLRENGIFKEVMSALGQVLETTTRMVERYEGHCDEIQPLSSHMGNMNVIENLAASEMLVLQGKLSTTTAKLTSVQKMNMRLKKEKRLIPLTSKNDLNRAVEVARAVLTQRYQSTLEKAQVLYDKKVNEFKYANLLAATEARIEMVNRFRSGEVDLEDEEKRLVDEKLELENALHGARCPHLNIENIKEPEILASGSDSGPTGCDPGSGLTRCDWGASPQGCDPGSGPPGCDPSSGPTE